MKNQIEELRKLFVGIKQNQVKVKAVLTRRSTDESDDCVYNLEINIGDKIKSWQILFSKLFNVPDFIFDGDDDTFNPDMGVVKTLWDPGQSTSLKLIVEELYRQCVIHEQHLLKDYPKLYTEWSDLCKVVPHNAIEVSVTKNGPGTYNDTVVLIIPIEVNYQQLPSCVSEEALGDAISFLHLSFATPNQTAVTASLEISPLLEYYFGDVSNMRIPTYGNTTLAKFVMKLKNLLTATVDCVSERYKFRRSFINTMRAKFYGSLVEYDVAFYYDASFLLAVNDVFYIFHIVLDEKFPVSKPVLCLQKVYTTDDSMDKQFINDVPYSRDKPNQHNVDNISSYIIKYIKDLTNG